mmetsp:Transcript_7153/g.9287  ORF Transcript_7153/g.9287 Transcript_7153/m.9287 type:complete len:164 (+) Transcript_7153:352-843(+)|eukprot:CAMPEP_0198141606 /NCGR_PEP_ID=MMETSP1443-20131203/4590_1 /TAXON_ID=186043 /ORGANISM="Entomoneis sp., Strain CCMP2396" /LENGTH=163 /DNA_ID=CAMNT_0043804405 /DNA_START=218 /DNA_END=709 /DNA_ORIENTATION=-
MTIYKDGKEQEKVELHELNNKEKLHALFREKGFVLKNAAKPVEVMEDERKAKEQKQFNDLKMNYFRTKIKMRSPDQVKATENEQVTWKVNQDHQYVKRPRGVEGAMDGEDQLLAIIATTVYDEHEWKSFGSIGLFLLFVLAGGTYMIVKRRARRKRGTGIRLR